MSRPLSQQITLVNPSTKQYPVNARTVQYSTRYDFDQPLIIISSLSICLAIPNLILSVLRIQESWLTVAAASLTIIFHATYFAVRHRDILRRRHHRGGPKTLPVGYSRGMIGGASLLAILYIQTIWVQITYKQRHAPHALATSTDKMVFNAGTALSVLEVLLIGLMAIMLGFARRHWFLHKDDNKISLPAPSLSREVSASSTRHWQKEKIVDMSLKV
jgi:hypothetical protein